MSSPHCLILGMTMSGKTTLAKRLAHRYKKSGIGILVLDPLHDPEWQADYQTDDPEEFLSVFWDSRHCAVFIDEAGESVGRYDNTMLKTATKGRHYGHRVHYISQGGKQVNKTVRDQCGRLFLFATALEDCKTHRNDWNKPGLIHANQLMQGEYFTCTRFGTLQKGNIFNEINKEKK